MSEWKSKITKIGLIIVSVPILVMIITNIKSPLKIEIDNDWIGFYASYFGAIIGVLGVYSVTLFDKHQREIERRNQRFFENIETYKYISNLLKNARLFLLKKELEDLVQTPRWLNIDTKTKNELNQLRILLKQSDEVEGLSEAIRIYVRNNFFDEMKVTMTASINDDEEFEYEDFPNEIIEDVTAAIRSIYKDSIEYGGDVISISKKDLIGVFNKYEYAKGYDNYIDTIHEKVIRFIKSSELKIYEEHRSNFILKAKRLSKEIDDRIEKVLTY